MAETLIPTEPGVYALHLHLAYDKELRIGKLGVFDFPRGDYVYVGSALGPGGLRGRVGRHARINTRFHWHIDWLREVTALHSCYYTLTEKHLECHWSRILTSCQDACIPARGFGASDCRNSSNPCVTHLVLLREGVFPDRLEELLASRSGLSLEYHSF